MVAALPSFTSVQEYLEANEKAHIAEEHRKRLKAQHTASAAQVVEGLGPYETWRSLVAAKRDETIKIRDGAVARLLSGQPAAGETLSDYMLKQRLLFAEAAGAAMAFETALQLIPNAVKAGEQSP